MFKNNSWIVSQKGREDKQTPGTQLLHHIHDRMNLAAVMPRSTAIVESSCLS